jgi:hypothetical protein
MERDFRFSSDEDHALVYERRRARAFDEPLENGRPLPQGKQGDLDGGATAPASKPLYHPHWAIMQLCITLALWVAIATAAKVAITWL